MSGINNNAILKKKVFKEIFKLLSQVRWSGTLFNNSITQLQNCYLPVVRNFIPSPDGMTTLFPRREDCSPQWFLFLPHDVLAAVAFLDQSFITNLLFFLKTGNLIFYLFSLTTINTAFHDSLICTSLNF